MSDSVSEDDKMLLSPKDGEQRQRRSPRPKRHKLKQNSLHFDEEFKKSPRLIQRRLTIDATAYEETIKKEAVENNKGDAMKVEDSGENAAGDKGTNVCDEGVSANNHGRGKLLDNDSLKKQRTKKDIDIVVEPAVVKAESNPGKPFSMAGADKVLDLSSEKLHKDIRDKTRSRFSRIHSDGDLAGVGVGGGQGHSVIGQDHQKLPNSRSLSDSNEHDVEKFCKSLRNKNSGHPVDIIKWGAVNNDAAKRSPKLHDRQKAIDGSLECQQKSVSGEIDSDKFSSPRIIRRGMSDNTGPGCKNVPHSRSKRAYTCDPLPRMEEEYASYSASPTVGEEQFTFEEEETGKVLRFASDR
jgi:hypothetical protein